ncbi:hydrogenase expression/formation protein HypE [Thermocaproicibacter melissae]|uniref:hydrogenase expression/formation protein HypE n=1 Tax=Thermocaproicibacter melissae TaxID=2966552 RepID=UPI0024B1FFA5|nr:hydrogenase expression/formation protein HypE [Thermocaproicibacter melissae]WBY63496.1 hydrogenase expression/formation protein HypE [Thermocaproicibacter melissae]
MKITMAHGSGGKSTSELIGTIFEKEFSDPTLSKMEDSAVLPGSGRIALTTDSFVVTPLFFPGGDIGRLCICGTVNDLLMSGAEPKYITCGFILEEGADTDDLRKIAHSMSETAKEAGVRIVAGDTKVVEGKGGVYINTAGVGFVPEGVDIGAENCREGDVILLSGNLGDHHAAVLSKRMGIENTIVSDCAPLVEMVNAMKRSSVHIHAMRDVTRGGLGTVLNEFAASSNCTIELQEESLPVSDQVRAFCGVLGLDPLYMGNEGKMVAVVAAEDAEKALACIRASRYGENAAVIGRVLAGDSAVLLKTPIGGTRVVGPLYGEGLPRIC